MTGGQFRVAVTFAAYAVLFPLTPRDAAAQVPVAQASAPPASLTMRLNFPSDDTRNYSVDLSEDGTGHYSGAATGASPGDLTFHLSPSTVQPWFADARALHFFQGHVEGQHKVAFTGLKTLRYRGADGSGETTFNYTSDQRLTHLVSAFQQLVLTLQLGQRLNDDQRFNRMALDGDMESLQHAIKENSAAHPEAIAPTLQNLADNPDALERVRRQAKVLLNAAPAH